MEQISQQTLSFIYHAYDLFQWPGVVILMAIESACIPLPSEIIMPVAGWMLVKENGLGATHTLWAGLYGSVGCVVGSTIAYWIGARGGRPMMERYGRYILVSPQDLRRADRWFNGHGEGAIFFSRLLPVVRTFISLPAGIARMHFAKFTLYTLLGSFPWCLGLAYGGYQLGEHWDQIHQVMQPLAIPIILAIVAFVAIYIYRHLKQIPLES